jgi:hypothetical protein
MTIKLIYFTICCLWVFMLTGCVKEIPVEEPVPETKTIQPEKPTQPSPRVLASLKLTDQGRRMLDEKKPDNAIRVLEQAISLNPGSGQNYYYLSEAWLMKKFVAEARKFNYLAESHVKGDEEWMRRVARQAERITELEIEIKKYR